MNYAPSPPASDALQPSQLDVGIVVRELQAGRATPEWIDSWIAGTWRSPARFQRALYADAFARSKAPVRSRPDVGIDFYADCVSEKLAENPVALASVEAGKLRELSCESLHTRCSKLASAWRIAGVKAGASIAILLPVGADYAVALLTALRLGAVVSPLPPHGRAYVRHRVDRIAPDFVVTSDVLRSLLPAAMPNVLSTQASLGDETFASAHSYAPSDVVLRLLSPFGDPEQPPFELCAGELHAALLRDAAFGFSLRPGDRIAAPGFDPLQWQPLTLLCAWIAGATFVELSARDIAADPRVLARLGVTVLGVSRRVRALVLAHGKVVAQGVRAWFRSLTEIVDYEAWEQLERMLGEAGQLGSALFFNAASSGLHLFSPPSARSGLLRLWPAPGRTFLMTQPGAGLLPSLSGAGVYTPLRDDEPDASLPRAVLTQLSHGFLLGGCIDAGPDARSLPLREIEASACRHPRLRSACLVVTPGRYVNDARSILVGFVPDPDPIAGAAIPSEEVLRLVSEDLGEECVPERLDCFALHPRFKDGVLDHAWCSSQYLSGALSLKARAPLFATLGRLAWIFESQEPPSE